MSREITFVDTTLRDGHQSLWATRMTTGMMLPILEKMDRIGFEAIDIMGPVESDVCVRYLNENPWERIRILRDHLKNTPLIASIRSQYGIIFDLVPDDIAKGYVAATVANGVSRIYAFDALLNNQVTVDYLRYIKSLGATAIGGLVFCESPVHTDKLYAAKAKELVNEGHADSIMIKDSGGLLTPDRIQTLVRALREAVGDVPISLHTHSMTGIAPLVYLEGIKAGANSVQTGIWPLALGAAQPSVQNTMENLGELGYQANLDQALIAEVSDYLVELAYSNDFPLGTPGEYNVFHFRHQLPGGMLSNLKFQLSQAGILNRFDETLEECALIREELGWPIMVTPFSQLVGVQALLNVVHGERYGIVPNEIKKFALGFYGKPLSPIDPDILDKILANGSKSLDYLPRQLEPALPELRKKYPKRSDEELILLYQLPENIVNKMGDRDRMLEAFGAKAPLMKLMDEVGRRKDIQYIHLEKESFKLDLNRGL